MLLFVGESRAEEVVVNVLPEDMQGWVIVTNKGGQGRFTNRGPAVFERERPFVADDGTDLGRGAYYAALGLEGDLLVESRQVDGGAVGGERGRDRREGAGEPRVLEGHAGGYGRPPRGYPDARGVPGHPPRRFP